jgi:uncharacterized protein (TIGR02646 family)
MRVIQRKPEPSLFSSKQFLKARADVEAQIAAGERPDFRKLLLTSGIRELLLEEFDHRCAYCDSTFESIRGHIDHFYPKSLFPKKAFEWNNLILSCQVCDTSKRDRFPVDASGNPLLIYPGFDNPNQHIKELDNGLLVGLTEKGEITINLLQLNRPYLVDSRKKEQLYRRIAEERPDLESTLFVDNFYQKFTESIFNIKEISIATDIFASSLNQPIRYMLYANVITCLETYLSDAFINTVKNNKAFMRQFVKTFHGFKNVKLNLTEVFAHYESIEEVAISAMADIIYHDLAKVSGMYKDTLGIDFPKDLGFLYNAVIIRHDIVHRNGKDKNGNFHSISAEEVEKLIFQAVKFVEYIQAKLLSISKT